MTSIRLVQPAAGGRLSGGFLYNARMAECGLWQLVDATTDSLPGLLEGLRAPGLILLDSIWLTREHWPLFLALRQQGTALGLMLHSFPSMIEATERGQQPRTRPTVFERDAIDSLDVVIVPGRHYVGVLAGTRTPLVVAEPGIDDAWRAEPRRRSGPCRLVSVGAVTPRKGFLDVPDALTRLGHPEYTWSIAGNLDVDPAYVALLRERTRGLPVTLFGQLDPADVRALVQRSDVLLMPSYDENQPLVLLEAMAASVPAVAYAAGATRSMLEHGHEGLISEIGDKASLATHVQQLVGDEPLRQRMAAACWQRQLSLCNWAAAALHAKADLQRVLVQRLAVLE